MAGYIIVDVKTRNILIACAIVAAFLFVIGIIVTLVVLMLFYLFVFFNILAFDES